MTKEELSRLICDKVDKNFNSNMNNDNVELINPRTIAQLSVISTLNILEELKLIELPKQ